LFFKIGGGGGGGGETKSEAVNSKCLLVSVNISFCFIFSIHEAIESISFGTL
jgi:hypothetical protein